jgi:hypothetical protein
MSMNNSATPPWHRTDWLEAVGYTAILIALAVVIAYVGITERRLPSDAAFVALAEFARK